MQCVRELQSLNHRSMFVPRSVFRPCWTPCLQLKDPEVWAWQDIMALEIEAIAENPSVLFLWCGRCAGCRCGTCVCALLICFLNLTLRHSAGLFRLSVFCFLDLMLRHVHRGMASQPLQTRLPDRSNSEACALCHSESCLDLLYPTLLSVPTHLLLTHNLINLPQSPLLKYSSCTANCIASFRRLQRLRSTVICCCSKAHIIHCSISPDRTHDSCDMSSSLFTLSAAESGGHVLLCQHP